MSGEDRRRNIPRTDALLALPAVVAARHRLSEAEIRAVIAEAQAAARSGSLPAAGAAAGTASGATPGATPDVATDLAAEVAAEIERALHERPSTSVRPVLNATGVIVHTNLGRAPLSEQARAAILAASGYVDIEMDLETGRRSPRGIGAHAALLRACPAAEDALIVNNGAAALLLAVSAYSGARPEALADAAGGSSPGHEHPPGVPGMPAAGTAPTEIVISRGELIEIGAGFRLPELMQVTGARLREIGTTNRSHPADYARALGAATGCVVKVHPSNFRVDGFASGVGVAELRVLLDAHEQTSGLRIPLIVDLGSGLLRPDPLLPDEPDIDGALRAGADLVVVSGDKLLGGPQAGLLLGKREVIERLRTHPLARAVRADKLSLAALEATLRGSEPPVQAALHLDPEQLRRRTEAAAARVSTATRMQLSVVPHDGRVGGGGAPGVPLPGWAIELPETIAARLRLGTPAVVARVHRQRCLIDLRCVPEDEDERLIAALAAALRITVAPRKTGAPPEAIAPPDPAGDRPLDPRKRG